MNKKLNTTIISREVRIKQETIDKLNGLVDYLREQNLMLIHGEHQIEIVHRTASDRTIATAFIL